MSQFELNLKPEDYQVKLPKKRNYGLGLIGCGGIANGAHLPAYQKAGYKVVGCCDISKEAMERTKSRWDIPMGCTELRRLLDSRKVQVVDIAIHNPGRVELVEQVAAAGKHILIQKPFAHKLEEALAMVKAAAKHKIKLAVNQQARWAPAHRAAKILLERGAIGKLFSIRHDIRGNQDDPKSWYVKVPNFNIVDHGIHYIDLSRFWAGVNAKAVHCGTVFISGQHAVDPMIYDINIRYHNKLQASLTFNNIVQGPKLMGYSFYLDGTEGAIHSNGSKLWLSRKDRPEGVYAEELVGSWFPDGFMGSMGDLMAAITEDREPQVSGKDNINSLKIAYAAVESSKSLQVVFL